MEPPCLCSQMRTELYFLSSQKNRPSLFGMPLIVPCTVHTTKKDLYDAVWIQVSRLASPLPPQEASNHAQDWYAQFLCTPTRSVPRWLQELSWPICSACL